MWGRVRAALRALAGGSSAPAPRPDQGPPLSPDERRTWDRVMAEDPELRDLR
jgi:hypothetical protein